MNNVQAQTSPNVEYRSLEKMADGPDDKVQTVTQGFFSRISQSVKEGVKKCFRRYEVKLEKLLQEKAITATDETFVLGLVKDKKVKGGKLLLRAASVGHIELVNILLKEKDVNCNERNKEGQTALMRAIIKGHTEVARALLEKDELNTATADNGGCTALTYATLYGREEIVNLIIERREEDATAQRDERWEELDQAREEKKESVPMLNRQDSKEDQYL